MALIKEQRIYNKLYQNPNIMGVRIITPSSNFEKRFDGSINHFFKKFKNSLQSVNGVSNREYFKDISGAYFSIDNSETFDIIILWDSSITQPSNLQMKIRIKKLLGNEIELVFGKFSEFEGRIKEMLGIVSKSQLFGEYYGKK